MLPFGLLGCFIVYFLHPLVKRFVSLFNPVLVIVISIILFVIYIIDSIVSFNIMNKIKSEIKKQKVDNTDVIKKKIDEWLSMNSFLYRHIKEAYPRFKINLKGSSDK